MSNVLSWMQRGLGALIVFVLLLWAALAFSIQISPENQPNRFWLDIDRTTEVQTRWLCFVAAGPACIVMDELAPTATLSQVSWGCACRRFAPQLLKAPGLPVYT